MTRLTAVIIFLAFAGRLFLVNAAMFASPETGAPTCFVPDHLTIVLKKRHDAEEIVKSSFENYSLSDIFEDDTDNEEDVSKSSSPVAFSFVYSFMKGTALHAGSYNSFNSIKSGLYPRKYLAFSILRI